MAKEADAYTKYLWYTILVFSFIDFIVSCVVAAAQVYDGGYRGLAFAAIWSMFLVLWMAYYNTSALRKNSWGSELMVGFLIGVSGMMSQMFFFLTCVFLGYGTSAASQGYKTEGPDKGMGSFCFFNFILYAMWTNLLINKRSDLIEVPPLQSSNDPYSAPVNRKGSDPFDQQMDSSNQSRAPESAYSAGRSFDTVSLTEPGVSSTNNDTIEI